MTRLCLWEALLCGSGLHKDFFYPAAKAGLCAKRWAQVLFSTGLSMFCFAITSFILSWFSLKFCICNFACSAALQISTPFSKFNSQFLADAHIPSHYFRSPPSMRAHESWKTNCFFKEKKVKFSSNFSTSLENSWIQIFLLKKENEI